MSISEPRASQIWAMESRVGEWQFHALRMQPRFALCRRALRWRNEVTTAGRHARDRPPIWRQNGARHTPCASKAILLIFLLCSASNSCLSRADGDEAARSEQGII